MPQLGLRAMCRVLGGTWGYKPALGVIRRTLLSGYRLGGSKCLQALQV